MDSDNVISVVANPANPRGLFEAKTKPLVSDYSTGVLKVSLLILPGQRVDLSWD